MNRRFHIWGAIKTLKRISQRTIGVNLVLLGLPGGTVGYEIKPSLEMSLLPYVEKYRSSTYFFVLHNSQLGPFWLDHGGRGG